MRAFYVLFDPFILVGGLILLRLCLLGSDQVTNPMIVAGVCVASLWIVLLPLKLFPPCGRLAEEDSSAILPNLFFQIPLLFASRDFMVCGSAATSWIWIAHVCLAVVLTCILLVQALRRELRQWNPEKSVKTLCAMIALWLWSLYGLTGLARTAYTEHYGSSEPGDLLERNHYQTTVKVLVRRKGEDNIGDDVQAEALVDVINRNIFWDRWREIVIKSVSFVKGHPHKVLFQDDRIFPREGDTSTYVTIVRGDSILLSLAHDEQKRLRR